MALPSSPNTRKEMYLSNMAGQGTALPSEPHTREEEYLDYIAKNGGGGGGTGDGDMKKSVYDGDLAVAGAGGIKSYVTGAISGKVDKVQGKGLSTNDYDDSAKAIVDNVTTALDGKADQSDVDAILNGTNIDSFGDVETALDSKVDNSKIGANNGVAGLDANGRVPSSQLPSYVDDVLEYASLSAFPATGETGKIYIALDTNKTFRWSGSAYVEISESLALGETAGSAYAGNKGKANADAISAMKDGSSIDSFGDVETALANKVDKVTGKGLSTNDYDNTAKGIVDNIQSNVIANTKLIKDTVGWSGKNKSHITLSKLKELNTGGTWADNVYTFKGLTFTIAHDGDSVISITQTGTSTGTGYLYLGYLPLKNGDSFILNGSPSNTTAQTTYMRVGKGGTEGSFFKSNYGGSETAIDISEDDNYSFNIACGASGITGTYVWKPMLRDANILDSTYEPYHESVEEMLTAIKDAAVNASDFADFQTRMASI